MTPEDPVALSRRFAEAALGPADLAAFDALVATDVAVLTGISPAAPIMGREAYKAAFAGFAEAFPVTRMEVHEVLPAGPGRAVLRFTAHAVHAKGY
jgi:ketosteroid isomerase-like protein